MIRRWRVERAVTDAGYADGWVVLDPAGLDAAERDTWRDAFEVAVVLAWASRSARAIA